MGNCEQTCNFVSKDEPLEKDINIPQIN